MSGEIVNTNLSVISDLIWPHPCEFNGRGSFVVQLKIHGYVTWTPFVV